MSLAALVLSASGLVLVGLLVGFLLGEFVARKKLSDADSRYDALKRDFEMVSAVNVRLMGRAGAASPVPSEENADDRFFELYDDAKRCLHRTLDQHNATAPRPLVISRDGSNLLQVLNDLPERSFSVDNGEDAGVRAWLRRVFELEMQRRGKRAGARAETVLALERERELWREPLKKRA
ncbi:MAG TPA: hypothetical protein VEF55_09460 [Candidatus Binatia bacterium]|nr:hypothetical protein [Candidatus Binatia bacterium]